MINNVCNVCSIFCSALCLEWKHLPFLFIHTYGKFDVLAAAIIVCASQHCHLNCGMLRCDFFSQECVFMMLYAHITMKDKTLHVTCDWKHVLRESKRVCMTERAGSIL